MVICQQTEVPWLRPCPSHSRSLDTGLSGAIVCLIQLAVIPEQSLVGGLSRHFMAWLPSLCAPEGSLCAHGVGVSLTLRMGSMWPLWSSVQAGLSPSLILSSPLFQKCTEDQYQLFVLCLLSFLSWSVDRWLLVNVQPGVHPPAASVPLTHTRRQISCPDADEFSGESQRGWSRPLFLSSL